MHDVAAPDSDRGIILLISGLMVPRFLMPLHTNDRNADPFKYLGVKWRLIFQGSDISPLRISSSQALYKSQHLFGKTVALVLYRL